MAFERTIDTFHKNHPTRRITQFEIAKLVCAAYEKSATVQNANRGVFPYDRNLLTDLDFAPATVYENAQMIEGDCNGAVTVEGGDLMATVDKNKNAEEITEETQGTQNKQSQESRNEEQPCNKEEDEENRMTEYSVITTSSGVVDLSFDQPPTSYMVSPKKILPSPKVTSTIKKRTVKCQKLEILTNSPSKLQLKRRMN